MKFPGFRSLSKTTIASILLASSAMTAGAADQTVDNLIIQQSATMYNSPLLLRSNLPAPGAPDYHQSLRITKDTIQFGEVVPAPKNYMILTKKSLTMYNQDFGTNSMYIDQDKILVCRKINNPAPSTEIKQGIINFNNGYTNNTNITYSTILSSMSTGTTKIDGPSITVTGTTTGTTTIAGGKITAPTINGTTVTSSAINGTTITGTTINGTTMNGGTVNATTSVITPYTRTTNLDVTQNVKATKINTQELYVVPNVWADYVFKPGYKLQSLNDVNAYIQKNGTLPGIPSEKEVAENGVSVGEMQTKLLEKIEEMTLHMIQMQARISELEEQVK